MMIVKRKKNGMSIVEIMGAIFILSFAVLAVASIFPAGLQMNRKTKIRMQALEISAGIVEELRHLPYYDPNASRIDILKLANSVTGTGWSTFNEDYVSPQNMPDWTPTVVKNSKVLEATSQIFFRDIGGIDTRADVPGIFTDDVAESMKIPAIQISPLSTGVLQFNYNPILTSCRIHRIVVTAHIEEFVAGTWRYSFIQLVTYRSDALTTTPGY